MRLDGFFDFFERENFTEWAFHSMNDRPGPFGHVLHTATEDTVHADDHAIPWRDQIDNTGFHASRPGSANGDGQWILGLKHLTKHKLDFVHDFQKVRVQVSDSRLGQSG